MCPGCVSGQQWPWVLREDGNKRQLTLDPGPALSPGHEVERDVPMVCVASSSTCELGLLLRAKLT